MVGMFFSSFYIFTVSYIQIRCAKLATFFEFTKVHIVFSQKNPKTCMLLPSIRPSVGCTHEADVGQCRK